MGEVAEPADADESDAKSPAEPSKKAAAAQDLAAQWKEKVAAWAPAIKAAIAAKGPTAADTTKRLAQATSLSKPGGDLAQAIDKLTECHTLATAAKPTAGKEASPEEQFKGRLAKLQPGIQAAAGTAVGDEAKLRASEAGVFARKKDFAKASEPLDQVDAILKTVASPNSGGGAATPDAPAAAEP